MSWQRFQLQTPPAGPGSRNIKSTKHAMIRVGFCWLLTLLVGMALLRAEEALTPWRTPARITVAGLLASGAADYGSTRYALAQGARETNPIFRWAMRHEPAGAALKFGVTGAVAWGAYYTLTSPTTSREARWVAIIVTGVIIGVNTWAAHHNLAVAHAQQQRRAAR